MLLLIDSRLPRGYARRSISWLPIRSRASSFLKWAIKTGEQMMPPSERTVRSSKYVIVMSTGLSRRRTQKSAWAFSPSTSRHLRYRTRHSRPTVPGSRFPEISLKTWGPRFFGFVRTITMNVLFPYMARTTRCCIHTTATMRWMSSGWRFRCSSMASE